MAMEGATVPGESPMARKHFRARVKAGYKIVEGKGGYEAVGRVLGLSGGMVWKFCEEPGYWPKDPVIRRRIEIKAREMGITVGRNQDLFTMEPAELLSQLQNRVEV